MRPWSLILLGIACAACTVRLPGRQGLGVGLRGDARAEVRAQVQVSAPPPPEAAVALEGAPVPEFFGIPLEGAQDVVFVLDCSGSMGEPAQGAVAEIRVDNPRANARPAPPGPTKIDIARNELIDALQRLPAGTRVDVIFFSSDVEIAAAALFALEDASREGLLGFVRDTAASGSTALAPAMRAAFLMNPRRVVLLSDGLGNVGGGSWDVLRDAREAMRGGVRIDTVGLGKGQDAELLGALAGESGGLYQAF